MRKLFSIIFFTFLFTPLFCFSEWFRLFTIDAGDLYLETNSIKRVGNKVFFSQLVNYRKKQSNRMLSFKINSEIDCSNLKIRDLNYETFKEKMGKGTNFYKGKPNKNWKISKSGSSVHFLNKILCDRVVRK